MHTGKTAIEIDFMKKPQLYIRHPLLQLYKDKERAEDRRRKGRRTEPDEIGGHEGEQ